jgi:hypothetical protein
VIPTPPAVARALPAAVPTGVDPNPADVLNAASVEQ